MERGSTEQEELRFAQMEKRICTKCGKNEVYRDIKNMDWCEDCIWEFVKDE